MLLLAVAATTIDLTRYFSSPSVEQKTRAATYAAADRFLKTPASAPGTPQSLHTWLASGDSLFRALEKHDIYVYLRSEEDTGDAADANADDEIATVEDRIDDKMQTTLASIGGMRLRELERSLPALQSYRFFIDSELARARHAHLHEAEISILADPALTSLSKSYRALRSHALDSQPKAAPGSTREAFDAKWEPYASNEEAFAAILIATVQIRNGIARLQGFSSAPAASYFHGSISQRGVQSILKLLRASSTYRDYQATLASAAAARLRVDAGAIHAWDVSAAFPYLPAAISYADAVPLILAAEQPMGDVYAREYARLFDPASGRIEICARATCDRAGFSVGFAGTDSGLFFGGYDGTPQTVRAVAHEAGHAVHRQFMNEHQPLAVYNGGPHFMFESFAIFNELLFLDHMSKAAASPDERAYYLRYFLDDITFQVYGSAEETDLEQSIYAGVGNGSIRTAADIDALTLRVFSQYAGPPALEPAMKDYWARDSLYFTDPVYDVNYLFAGLLALEYFDRFERNPKDFSQHYVALLQNGFTDTPAVLERKFLGIDLQDDRALVRDANAMIARRSKALSEVYASPAP